jgi:uncharacterized membrane protein YoaK (UPF0700 family)
VNGFSRNWKKESVASKKRNDSMQRALSPLLYFAIMAVCSAIFGVIDGMTALLIVALCILIVLAAREMHREDNR